MNVMEDDRNAPATKGDLEDIEARLNERMRDMQTKLLKAFFGFAESAQARFRAEDDTEAGLKQRIATLEERLLEMERRVRFPPAA